MAEKNEYLKQKENVILDITNQLISWDNSVEHALQILEENDHKFSQLRELDQNVSEDELRVFNEDYRNHWQKMINMQQELMQFIQKSQVENQQQLAQIDNKNKVVSNYMAIKNKSIFIEKDY